ncbi:DUF924 domain-containing protein [Chromobacterium phragmitis]|uniref:DUF924 domain-containing protein n=1 Tax=Chromobacterium phragmitis TaxID=2202141 RepID=A0A344UMD3_9NEIS|nr:DUF924 family protein [Chromobacterium phragmitis]AXE31044.1 DUF924 domain-containing protein [Chromobacterium phragmitis]AXE36431.1 DUF924 domain-containing protein [Chromobacterium phragmitis]
MPIPMESPDAVLRFWRDARADWFSQDPAFDRRFAERFAALHKLAAHGQLSAWRSAPQGSLALAILLDQYPRNAFRGAPRMYATDTQALAIVRAALAAGHWDAAGDLRLFLCLPFAHSENMADQTLSVALNARLGQPWLSHAEGHRDIIRRFGRFPHRNAILGRPSTPAETAFLANGGFSG